MWKQISDLLGSPSETVLRAEAAAAAAMIVARVRNNFIVIDLKKQQLKIVGIGIWDVWSLQGQKVQIKNLTCFYNPGCAFLSLKSWAAEISKF